MSLMDFFSEYIVDIEVFSLGNAVGAFGTTEPGYPGTATKTIEGILQPGSGSNILKNESNKKVSTHTLFVLNTVTLNTTDKLKLNDEFYQITFYPKNGIAGIGDHKEIGLEII